MAVSSTATFDLTRDQIIGQAATMAGQLHEGHEPDADQIHFGKTRLQALILGLQKDGVIIRTVERVEQSIAVDDTGFTAASDAIEIHPVATLKDSSNVESEAVRISRDDYMRRSVKTTVAPPLEFCVDRTSSGTVTVKFPVKSDRAYTFTYQKVRKLRDTDTGNVTLDLGPQWLNPVIYMLAHDFALKAGMLERAGYLRGLYEPDKARAMLDETERGRIRFVVGM